YGDEKGFGFNANTLMYDADVARMRARQKGVEEPPRKTDLTWVVAAEPSRKSYAFLLVNTHEDARHVELSVRGCTFGDAVVHAITCQRGLERVVEMPGEPKPWRVDSCQRRLNGGMTIPAQSIIAVEASVTPNAEKVNKDFPD
ncbi:MAG: hypothetical protein KBT68_01125, partial [bacterium]|nr:hypothetical protein [Candidatus Colisoma equi]